MSVGVGPILERPGASRRVRPSPKTSAAPLALRLPEDRAFEVATINRRLASMARDAAPEGSRRSLKP